MERVLLRDRASGEWLQRRGGRVVGGLREVLLSGGRWGRGCRARWAPVWRWVISLRWFLLFQDCKRLTRMQMNQTIDGAADDRHPTKPSPRDGDERSQNPASQVAHARHGRGGDPVPLIATPHACLEPGESTGAGGGIRTLMPLRTGDFESPASAVPPLRPSGPSAF